VRVGLEGPSVAGIVRRTIDQDSRFERSLLLVDIQSGSRRALTPGRRNVTSPQWSPSGARLAFLDAEDGNPAQLYVMPVGGGDARRVTELKRGGGSDGWGPGGREVGGGVANGGGEGSGGGR